MSDTKSENRNLESTKIQFHTYLIKVINEMHDQSYQMQLISPTKSGQQQKTLHRRMKVYVLLYLQHFPLNVSFDTSINSLLAKCSSSYFKITFFQNGLYFFNISRPCFLINGLVCATLKGVGTQLCFIMDIITGTNSAIHSFRSQIGKGSSSQNLLTDLLMILSTVSLPLQTSPKSYHHSNQPAVSSLYC